MNGWFEVLFSKWPRGCEKGCLSCRMKGWPEGGVGYKFRFVGWFKGFWDDTFGWRLPLLKLIWLGWFWYYDWGFGC